jgi:hypothetical protein
VVGIAELCRSSGLLPVSARNFLFWAKFNRRIEQSVACSRRPASVPVAVHRTHDAAGGIVTLKRPSLVADNQVVTEVELQRGLAVAEHVIPPRPNTRVMSFERGTLRRLSKVIGVGLSLGCRRRAVVLGRL